MFLLKWDVNGKAYAQIYGTNWKLPKGYSANVSIGFDKAFNWSTRADGIITGGGTTGLAWDMSNDQAVDMIEQNSKAGVMWIGFGTAAGAEKPWRIDLAGGMGAVNIFRMCTVSMLGTASLRPPAPQLEVPAPPAAPADVKYPAGKI